MFYNLVHDISWAVFTQGSRELDMKFFPDPNSDKDYKYLLADGFSLNHDSYKLKCLDTHSVRIIYTVTYTIFKYIKLKLFNYCCNLYLYRRWITKNTRTENQR